MKICRLFHKIRTFLHFKGESAALVSAKAREVQNFAVSINVAAGNNVTFRLDYDELLIRKSGVYKQVIYADPGQVRIYPNFKNFITVSKIIILF